MNQRNADSPIKIRKVNIEMGNEAVANSILNTGSSMNEDRIIENRNSFKKIRIQKKLTISNQNLLQTDEKINIYSLLLIN